MLYLVDLTLASQHRADYFPRVIIHQTVNTINYGIVGKHTPLLSG
jgi:hypothetical protein